MGAHRRPMAPKGGSPIFTFGNGATPSSPSARTRACKTKTQPAGPPAGYPISAAHRRDREIRLRHSQTHQTPPATAHLSLNFVKNRNPP